jgi:small subunit ribosomal protein S6
MRKYETIFIINPDLSEEDSKGVIEKVRGLVEDLQGEVLKIEEWGKKRLAYEVKKMSKGLFVILHFTGTIQVLSELERNLRLMDAVLKYQTVRLDEKAEKLAELLSTEKPSETAEKPESEAEKPESEAEKPESEAETPRESPKEGDSRDEAADEQPPQEAEETGEPTSKTEEGADS